MDLDLYRGKEPGKDNWLIGSVIQLSDEEMYLLADGPIDIERPAYNAISVGAGLEDQEITDRYYAAEYGWEEALIRYEEKFPTWVRLDPKTVTKCADKADKNGNVLFTGDIIQNPVGLKFEIRYGHHSAYCPADHEYMDNVGFYCVSDEVNNMFGSMVHMPLGETEVYAEKIGNIFDDPKLKMASEYAGQEGLQGGLLPAT